MQILEGVTYVGMDTETFLISAQNLAPKMVCVSTAYWDAAKGEYVSELLGNGDAGVEEAIASLLRDPTIHIVAQNAAYDMGVFCRSYPALTPLVFAAYAAERIHCTIVREKLLNLSDFGDLKEMTLPSGGKEQISYRQDVLEKKYLGLDRSAQKEGDDIWRLNFASLDGMRADQYDPEAADYAKEDSLGCLRIFFEQQRRQVSETGSCSMNTSEFEAAADFALFMISCRGMAIDPVEMAKIEVMLEEAAKPEKLNLLLGSGILRPAEPPRPYANTVVEVGFDFEDIGLQEKRDLIHSVWSELGTPEKTETTARGAVSASVAAFKRAYLAMLDSKLEYGTACQTLQYYSSQPVSDAPTKMTKGTKESINTKKLAALVAQMRTAAGLSVVFSNPDEPDETKRNVCCKAEVIAEISHLSPVLEQYEERQKLRKLVTTELPRMRLEDGSPAPVVHFTFNSIVETLRTSSYAGGIFGKGAAARFVYPSANGQNVDPRVRPCYIPRPGYLLCSIDYSSIELVSAAQRQLDLFGHSKLADLLNEGVDLHAYMGAQLAYNLNDDFRNSYNDSGRQYDEREIYEVFYACKADEREEVRAFFRHWRKFAKPVNLGYPGGLGAATFISFAKGYGVTLDIETAGTLKKIWLETFPEFAQGFQWVNDMCPDPRRPILGYRKDGRPISGYAYTTPMGAYRAACVYTSACNGIFLQSPTAAGAKIAVYDCVQACYDPSLGSIAQGCFPVDFVHDELLFEIPIDGYEHERAFELANIMETSMKLIFTDVPVAAEPALMTRWYKEAEQVLDDKGRLIAWEPSSN